MIPLYKPYVPELPNLSDVVYSGKLSFGKYSKEFEYKLSIKLDSPNTLIVNSFSNAMFIVLTCIGVKPGDYVIVSPMCCLASTQPLSVLGLNILWADVDPKTGTLCPYSVKELLKYNVKAILHNHFAGYVGHIDEINAIASEYSIPVIDDCIEAFGSKYKNKYLNQHKSDYTLYSFNPVRFLNTVDGGAISFKSKSNYDLAILLRDAGIDRSIFRDNLGEICPNCDIHLPAYSATPNEIFSYIGLMQLDSVDSLIKTHQKNAQIFNSVTDDSKFEQLYQNHSSPNNWVSAFLVDDNRRMIQELSSNHITASAIHLRNDNYSIFRNDLNINQNLPGVDEFSRRFLAIPCGYWLSDNDIRHIKSVLKELN